jgi:protein-disulfide isomerase
VAIIEYSDFECPFCGVFARETLPVIEAELISTGKATLYFKHFPLTAIHPQAFAAAEVAECAARGGRFWQVHDFLFSTPKLDVASVVRAHEGDSSFKGCRDGQSKERVASDIADAKALGISSTPTFLIGRVLADGRVRTTRRLSGNQPPAAFRDAVDQAAK